MSTNNKLPVGRHVGHRIASWLPPTLGPATRPTTAAARSSNKTGGGRQSFAEKEVMRQG